MSHLCELYAIKSNYPESASGPAFEAAVTDQPAWDLSTEYASFEDPVFLGDLERVRAIVSELEALEPRFLPALDGAESLKPDSAAELVRSAQQALILSDEAAILFRNIATFVSCISSVDGKNQQAKEYKGIFSALDARLDKSLSALELLLARGSDAFAAAVLAIPETSPHGFRISQTRKYRNRLLPLKEEKLISSLQPDGHEAWGELYNSISGTARCALKLPSGEERSIGLAEAASLWRESDPALREAGYRAQASTFTFHEESLAAILNAIAGWRLSEAELRSLSEKVHFLDPALAQNRISGKTLEAMLGAVAEERGLGRRALKAQARLLGVEHLNCWDILAPAPALPGKSAKRYSFAEGFELVRRAYASVDPAMGDFVLSMQEARRIEARVLDSKRPGAYCTRFAKSRTPRVFQTYKGSLSDVFTLSHELGHAYHGWLLKDLHLRETSYPMTLAETASTFAETALGDFIAQEADSDEAGALDLAWSDAQDAATFLINIPVRFAFEKAFYEARAEKPLGAAALTELMEEAWREGYGDSLATYDGHFWKSKLHFYFTGTSFYNFPYTFGYLFSLGVYARRKALGADFHAAYCALLRDTGRMEAEELAKKHLGVDLTEREFWKGSLSMLRVKVERFEALVERLLTRGGKA